MSSITSGTNAPATRNVTAGPRRRAGHRPGRGEFSGLLFVLPFVVVFGAFLLWPIVQGLWMSFTNRSLTGGGRNPVGLSNYAEALADPQVWQALGNTAVFTVLSSVPLVVLSFVMAFLVYSGLPGQWLWRLAYFAPYLLPVSVVTAIWGWLFQPDLGLINGTLLRLGLNQVPWLTDEHFAMWSVVLVTVWWTIGFNFLLYLSALQAIPEHLYEAAEIDGAGPARRLWSITLPMVRSTTGLIVVLQVLASLKVFEQIYLLTNGGPNNATRSVLEYIYDVGFTGYRLGYASAISYLFFILVLLISLAQLLFTRKER